MYIWKTQFFTHKVTANYEKREKELKNITEHAWKWNMWQQIMLYIIINKMV